MEVSMDQAEQVERVAVAPERLAWRKNIPYIYQSLLTIALPGPSRTVEWLPEVRTGDRSQEVILGTLTGADDSAYLRFGRIKLPNPQVDNLDTFRPSSGTFSSFSSTLDAEFEIAQRIDHLGGVNRARRMPQNANIIGSISSVGQVAVFDRTKFPLNPCGTVMPSITLSGHTKEGAAISWCPETEGMLVTGASDSKVMVWDIKSGYSAANTTLSPVYTLEDHKEPVNDVRWSPFNFQLVASASTDHTVLVSDWRTPTVAQRVDLGHSVVSVSFNPSNEFLIAAGCSNGSIKLLDTRVGAALHTMDSTFPHTGSVMALEWNKRHTAYLASGSSDTHVNIWDTSLIADGKEHRFKHVGHQAEVTDLSWNPAHDMVLASADIEGCLQIWEPILQ